VEIVFDSRPDGVTVLREDGARLVRHASPLITSSEWSLDAEARATVFPDITAARFGVATAHADTEAAARFGREMMLRRLAGRPRSDQ
jgi:hypothetical protein